MSRPQGPPSFARIQRWKTGMDRMVRCLIVLATVIMVNVFASRYYHRFYLSSQTHVALSSRSLAIVNSITNQVTVTLYYDTQDSANFYSTLYALACEYHEANPNIIVRTVDYERDPGEAEKVKKEFDLPGTPESPNAPPNKDLVIFSSGKQHDYVPGEAIVKYRLERTAPDDPDQKELQFRKKPVAFNGEVMFTSKLLALAHVQPLRAYYVQGHGEASLSDTTEPGYAKFGLALAQNDLQVTNLELLGSGEVPMDCALLIIAAPIRALDPTELQKIDRYLSQGGKLLALLNYESLNVSIGLEPILQQWGINAVPGYVKDPDNSIGDQVVVVRDFNPKSFVNPLTQLALEMVLPRPIAAVNWATPPANPPQVDELAFSSGQSTLAGDPSATRRRYPLVAASQAKVVAGRTQVRGITRIVAVGDSVFLDNQIIDAAANRDFLNYAVNWLLDREELLSGINPTPVTEYRLVLTRAQARQLDWALLAGLPGGVLFIGWLVWLVRRK